MNFSEWLKKPGVERCYLIEAQYRLAGTLKMLYRSTHPFRTGPTDTPAWTPYPAGILRMAEFEREMSEVFTGSSRSQQGSIDLFLDDEVFELSHNASFGGLPVTIKIGAPDWEYSDFIGIVTNAIADDLKAVSENKAQLSFKDRAAIFDVPIQSNFIAAGPNVGKPKPLCFGRCYNVSPVLLDAATNKWLVHDGDIEGVTVLRESGNPIVDFTDHLDGTFTINRSVTGRITADVDGAKPSGVWLQTGEDFIDYILANMGLAAPVDTGVYPTYLLGLYIAAERNVSDVLDEITATFVGSWMFDRLNQFRLRLYQVPA
jgi:hypothetical protein